jgi:Arc/MetJ-type ribon-helix-helix transcriptional regulator
LRRLDPDEVYADALLRGLPKVTLSRGTQSEAVRAGLAPSQESSRKTAARLRTQARKLGSSAMVEAMPTPAKADDVTAVKKAARRKLAAKTKQQ